MENTESIHVALASDRNYLPHACVAIASLLVHHKHSAWDYGLNVYFLHQGLTEEDFDKIRALNTIHPFNFIPVEVPESAFAGWKIFRKDWGIATYYRLVLPSLLPDVKKVIYIDCDLLVLSDIAELWNIPLDSFHTAAVATKITPEQKAKIGLTPEDRYFNAGVMVYDLDAMRKADDEARFRFIYETKLDLLKYPDQDILNMAYRNAYKLLPLKWNLTTSAYRNPPLPGLYSEEETLRSIRNPGIAHFTGVHKPWRLGKTTHHPYSSYYWEYMKLTPFAKDFFWTGLLKKFINGRLKAPKLATPWARKDVNRSIPIK